MEGFSPGWFGCRPPILQRGDRSQSLHTPRFLRKRPTAAKPIVHTAKSGIIRGCRKAKISEFTTQITQQLTGLRDRLERIEGVLQTT